MGTWRRGGWGLSAVVMLIGACTEADFPSFVNWESPHVHPLDLTPDGAILLAVNTADNRLELFDVTGDSPLPAGDVPVGLDPVSVRARTATEAWVVNHISDSISIVDLPTRRVVRTLHVGDEPCDVVFAGDPLRAFVTVSQENRVCVFNPANLDEAPIVIDIEGEDPRALAVDPGGSHVYAAIFESGNGTTIVPHEDVSREDGPYGGQNPPPNAETSFTPEMAADLPHAPEVGQVVKKVGDAWLDANGRDWSGLVTWDLHDHDLAVIDANTLAVGYVTGLMNLDMALAVHPSGPVTVVGSEALNQVRFEPNVRGVFGRMMMVVVDPASKSATAILDLNPHLDYQTRQVDGETRRRSISEPRAVVWEANGGRGFVAGMGSDNVVVVDLEGRRIGEVAVASGPTGLALDEAKKRLFVLCKFSAAIVTVSTDDLGVASTVRMFDPTPEAIKRGRPHLYNATKSSGLGHLSCASCHVDARMDQIAWDLGDPAGQVKTLNQSCNIALQFVCSDWHPMKGPMTTQTLVGSIGTEPLHWRGDREDLAAFNGAFESLLANDRRLTDEEMAEFAGFLATLTPPPNPFRRMDHSLLDEMAIRGRTASPSRGFDLFLNAPSDGGVFTCTNCHSAPAGTFAGLIAGKTLATPQDFNVAQLRDVYEKTGFDKTSRDNNRGFGVSHDGAFDNVAHFLEHVVFTLPTDRDRLDLEAFVMSFAGETHAAVGVQTTVAGDGGDVAAKELLQQMIGLADTGAVGLVAKGPFEGTMRGYAYLSGEALFQADRVSEKHTLDDLLARADEGSEITFTVVPFGTHTRIGIDRDNNGVLDGDE